MKIPKLQLACDQSDLPSALASVRAVGDIVDIIEVGTVLLLQVGELGIRSFRALFPDKLIVADPKCADAGGTVAKNCHKAGANYMTCICVATTATMLAAKKEIETIQVELYGDWTFENAQIWLENGINEVIYHQSRDALLAGETWGDKDLEKVKRLIEMGFNVSVTGGLELGTLELFKSLEIETIIVGRGITEAENPAKTAKEFIAKIQEVWG